jgi:glycosyltransferase involved in cell wall biosynthesis
MKICFDNEIFWTEQFGSISSRYFFNLINTLSTNNNNLDVKVFAKFYLNKKLDDLSKQIVVGNRIKFKPPFGGRIFRKLNSFFLNKRINEYNPDIIHKTYYTNLLPKNHKSKVVLTVMDLWHEKNNENYRPKDYSLKISDHILCPSISTKNDLIEIYNIDEKKITVTYFGVEKFENVKIKNDITSHNKPFLLFVGARGRYKNFNNFIEAYAKSEMLQKNFNIICFGGVVFSKDEINLFKKLKIFDSISREKNNDDQTLLTLYKNAKCLVYPSSHEGLGLPPIEAMSLGCPTITSNHPAIVEGVGKASAIFNPNNIIEIKQVLEKNLRSADNLNKLTDLGYIQSKNFSWDKCAKETLDVYKKLLD